MGVPAFFGFTSGQDDKNSTMVIAQAFQGGLGMPDRDYYTKDDADSKKLRDQYVAHVTKMLTLRGRTGGESCERCEENPRPRNFAGETRPHARGTARSAKELQQDECGGAAGAHAELELGGILQGDRSDRRRGTSTSASPISSRAPTRRWRIHRWTIGKPICAGNSSTRPPENSRMILWTRISSFSARR